MPLLSVNTTRFGFGGANLTPQSSAGTPSLGEVMEAAREDVFLSRFDWTAVAVAAASDLDSLRALINVLTTNMFAQVPVGAAGYGMRNLTPALSASDLLAFLIVQVNACKAALINTGSTDYSALSGTADATDQAEAITLANAIRTALSIADP